MIGQMHTKGFTLVELLVVVSIMVALLALTVPAFQGIGQGSKLRTATFNYRTASNLSRQMAITTRQDVHILFPDSELDYSDPVAEGMAYAAYGVYGTRDGYIGEWRRLPNGVVFHDTFVPSADNNDSQPFNIFLQLAATPRSLTNYLRSVPFPLQVPNATTQAMLAFTFRPDGALAVAGFNRKSVFFTEGWTAYVANQWQAQFDPDAPVFGLELRPETGQMRFREYNNQP